MVLEPAAGEPPAGHLPVGFIVGVAACSLVALGALAAVAAGGAVPAGIGLTLALLPIPALLAAVLYLDRLQPEPPGALVFVFAWGAAVAALIGLIGTLAGHQLLTGLRSEGACDRVTREGGTAPLRLTGDAQRSPGICAGFSQPGGDQPGLPWVSWMRCGRPTPC
jgi:hypothetical protein